MFYVICNVRCYCNLKDTKVLGNFGSSQSQKLAHEMRFFFTLINLSPTPTISLSHIGPEGVTTRFLLMGRDLLIA